MAEKTSAYWNFGQFGSAVLDRYEDASGAAHYLYPPKGMVVVAITALYDSQFRANTGLVSEFTYGSDGNYIGAVGSRNFRGNHKFITTANGANTQSAHEIGDFQVVGCDGIGSASTTLTLGNTTEKDNIQVGQIIESVGTAAIPGNAGPTTGGAIPRDLENPVRIAAYDGASTVTMSRALNISATANLTVSFYNIGGQGHGGSQWAGGSSGHWLKTGITIYGRWTQVGLSNVAGHGTNDAGGVVCYFGPGGPAGESYGYNPIRSQQ